MPTLQCNGVPFFSTGNDSTLLKQCLSNSSSLENSTIFWVRFLLNFYSQFRFSFLQWNENFRISIQIFKVIQFAPPPVWDSLSISRKTIWLGIRTHPGFVILTTTQKYKTSLILLRDDNLKFYKRFFTLRKIQRPQLGKFFELWTLRVSIFNWFGK